MDPSQTPPRHSRFENMNVSNAIRDVSPDPGSNSYRLMPGQQYNVKPVFNHTIPFFVALEEDSDEEEKGSNYSGSIYNRWGYCEICNVPLNSEKQAIEHVGGTRHLEKEEEKKRPEERMEVEERKPTMLYINGRLVKDGDEESIDPRLNPRFDRNSSLQTDDKTLWIIGTGEMKDLIDDITAHGTLRQAFRMEDYSFVWHCARCLKLSDVVPAVENLMEKGPKPSHIILHIGGYDLGTMPADKFVLIAKDVVKDVQSLLPRVRIIWNQLLPRFTGYKDSFTLNKDRREIDDQVARFVLDNGGGYIRFTEIQLKARIYYGESRDGDLTLSRKGQQELEMVFTGGVRSCVLRDMSIVPHMKDLLDLCSEYVRHHILPLLNRKRDIKRAKFRH